MWYNIILSCSKTVVISQDRKSFADDKNAFSYNYFAIFLPSVLFQNTVFIMLSAIEDGLLKTVSLLHSS